MEGPQQSFWGAWSDRLRALRNIPPVLKIVWQSGPWVVGLGLLFRLIVSVIPIGLLWVAARIIDGVVDGRNQTSADAQLFLVAGRDRVRPHCFGRRRGRIIAFLDTLLADRYSRHVSVLVLDHASKLDLATYENPLFTTDSSALACRQPIGW